MGSLEPFFKRVAIVGFGLIGGSIARAASRRWPTILIVPIEPQAAAGLAAVAGADLVVLAAPVLANISLLAELPAHVSPSTIVTDTGSTKRATIAAAQRVPSVAFIGGHPMAGSERSGRAHARADLFDGRPWLLVHGSADAGAEQRLERFVAGLGAIPLWLDATTHDRVIAYVSHVPQVLAVALMDAAADRIGMSGLRASGRAFAEMTRLASSPADLWEDILATNADFIGDALDEIVRRFPTSADLNERTWVRDIFRRAAAARAGQAGGPTSNE